MRRVIPLLLVCLTISASPPSPLDLGLREISAELASGRVSSAELVREALARIAAIDHGGPRLNAVLAVNPQAVGQAEALDRERGREGSRGPLMGVPVLIKDNIETLDLPTTAGSLALAQNATGRDAPLVARLRRAGMVVLGKTNLSEWANLRGARPVSGWSGVGGLTRNPYALDRSACGSSSGSGAAVAAGLAPVAIGTETDGSITCPASVNGVVGLKPTVGLVSRRFIVPISHTQDTAGPMARHVADAAALLNVIAGSDPDDPATREADRHVTDYTAGLSPDALKGARLGVLRFYTGYHPELDQVFARALQTLRDAGATLVDIDALPAQQALGDAETTVLMTEFKADLDAYLTHASVRIPVRSLADVMAFNRAHAERELTLFGQELFDKAEATKGLSDPAYVQALATARRLAGPEGIDRMLAGQHLDALVAPTNGPAWRVDTVNGDHDMGGAAQLPAVAGVPHLSLPMGMVAGLPVGLSIIGPAWSEARLLQFAFAFEARSEALARPGFAPGIRTEPPLEELLAPWQAP